MVAGSSRRNPAPRTLQPPRVVPKPGLALAGLPRLPGRARHRVGLLPLRGLRLLPWSGCSLPRMPPPRARKPAPKWVSRPRPRPTPPTTPPPTTTAEAIPAGTGVGTLPRHPVERRHNRPHPPITQMAVTVLGTLLRRRSRARHRPRNPPGVTVTGIGESSSPGGGEHVAPSKPMPKPPPADNPRPSSSAGKEPQS